MASSKTFVLLVLAFAVVLLISSQVSTIEAVQAQDGAKVDLKGYGGGHGHKGHGYGYGHGHKGHGYGYGYRKGHGHGYGYHGSMTQVKPEAGN